MQAFLAKHCTKIKGILHCFDRVIIRGHLPISNPEWMDNFLSNHDVLLKDFQPFVKAWSSRLVASIKALAEDAGRPYIYINRRIRNEEVARKIAHKDGVLSGLICILSKVERCSSFKVVPGKGRPRLLRATRQCLCLYLYFQDPVLGFMHVRIQSWFPFTIQVYLNGHSWLAERLNKEGIAYQMLDNAFYTVADGERAQRLANRFVRQKWLRKLNRLACKVNPLLQDLLYPMKYYWVVDQAEFSTDIIYHRPADLSAWYAKAIKHAITCFGAEDVMTFLGRKLHHAFAGQIVSDVKRRWPGIRIKHRVKENWIKMYDKGGCILRVETVINRPSEFKVRRKGKRHGQVCIDWFPLTKGIAYLFRFAEVAKAANERYLHALAVVEYPSRAFDQLHQIVRPVKRKGRFYRGFNPAKAHDVALMQAVMRGEYHLKGFRNRDIRERLFPRRRTRRQAQRDSAAMTRLLKRLHVRGLIAKIPRSRRWRVTEKGAAIFGLVLTLYHSVPPKTLTMKAA